MKIFGKKIKIFGHGMEKVNFIIPYIKNKIVLDIGVVQHSRTAYELPNWLHKNLKKEARDLIGIDVLESEVNYLRELGYIIYCEDAQCFNLNRKFNVIVLGDVIEHLHDYKGLFSSIDKHISLNGKIIITTANPWFFIRILQGIMKGRIYENPEHTTWFSVCTLSELLKRYGYCLQKAEYGSSESFLFKLFFIPKIFRHTGIWFVFQKCTT